MAKAMSASRRELVRTGSSMGGFIGWRTTAGSQEAAIAVYLAADAVANAPFCRSGANAGEQLDFANRQIEAMGDFGRGAALVDQARDGQHFVIGFEQIGSDA